MIGLILVSHGQLATELHRASELILGPQKDVEAIGIEPDSDIEALGEHIRERVHRFCAQGSGAVILTDMFGGTPTNISAPCIALGQVEVITAMNLPMVMKCLNNRQRMSFEDLCVLLVESGRSGIVQVGKTLAGK